MAKFTKQAIMKCLMDMLKTQSVEKITVKDICETCEINRNTFYYYFSDIYDVLDSVFAEETKTLLEFEDNLTFYETYKKAAAIIIEYRKAVIHIYNSKNKQIVVRYLEKVSNILVRHFVENSVRDCNVTDGDIRYITSFYSYAIVGVTSKWIEEGMPPYNVDLIKRLSDSYDATIENMISICEKNNMIYNVR